MESIAQEHGYFWQTLWEHPNNAELKAKRQNPDVLLPGDVVYIPEKRLKEEPGATEQRHRFKRKGVPSMLRLVLKDENDEPRVGVPYVLEIDGKLSSGETDSAGRIERPIPPDAQRGKLIVGTGNDQEEHQLQLGHMDPVTEITGVQGRLKNLGYDCGETSGVLDAKTQEAIRAFQAEHGLEVTGEADEATQQELENQHGS
jgi:N-acetylmuramoyl-L-alanine amidase